MIVVMLSELNGFKN